MPRSRKKRTSQAAHAFTASGWDSLPTELAHQIIKLACHDTATAAPRRTVPRMDTSTLINVSLISRDFYHLTGPLRASLYRQINVTGVSALQGLHQTLTAQPQLASLVKSLRVGPMTSLPRTWWPLVRAHSEPRSADSRILTWIKTSLDEKQLPVGCRSQRFWSVSHPCPRDSCRDVYIWNTLQRAQQALRISLTTDGRCSPGTHASGWVERVFYCQAILDLCLLKIREMEDADPGLCERAQPAIGALPLACAMSTCGHYPPLVIKNIKKRNGKGPPNAEFALTIPQLLRHLARRGALTDHFHHPIHFARSGAGRLSGTPCVPLHHIRECGAQWQFDSNEANSPLEREQEEESQGPGAKSSDQLGTPTTTLTTILRWSRAILASIPNLETLSLAGYLEQVFAKQQTLPNLRRLSIGPQPGTMGTLLTFGGLEGVRELRLCCGVPAYREAVEISTKMRRLERVKWYMSTEPCESSTPLIIDALNGLLGRNDPAAATAAAAVGSPIHSDRPAAHEFNFEDLGRLGLEEREGCLVEAFLPQATLLHVLRKVGSAEIEAAWRTGGAFADTRHRLLLNKVEDADDDNDVGMEDSDDDKAPSWENLCEQEFEWWDTVANQMGDSDAMPSEGEEVDD